jgi:hypothetical protein
MSPVCTASAPNNSMEPTRPAAANRVYDRFQALAGRLISRPLGVASRDSRQALHWGRFPIPRTQSLTSDSPLGAFTGVNIDRFDAPKLTAFHSLSTDKQGAGATMRSGRPKAPRADACPIAGSKEWTYNAYHGRRKTRATDCPTQAQHGLRTSSPMMTLGLLLLALVFMAVSPHLAHCRGQSQDCVETSR